MSLWKLKPKEQGKSQGLKLFPVLEAYQHKPFLDFIINQGLGVREVK